MNQTISVPGHDPINLNIGAFIDGAFRPSMSERTIPSVNPATGETLGQIAWAFLVYAGQSNMKKVQLEADGESPNIIMADTTELDRAESHLGRVGCWIE